jgi:preprotein translocase subunit YajC
MQQLPFLLLMFGALYIFMVRPQKKKLAEQRKLLDNVAEGTEVMTTSGIYGFVTAVEGDVVWLEIASGVDIRMAKAAIARIVDTPASPGIDAPTDVAKNDTLKNDTLKNDTATNDPTSNDSGGSSGDN